MVGHVAQKIMFQRFLHSRVTGSLVLVDATAIALIWAKSHWGDYYVGLSHTYLGIQFGEWELKLTLSSLIKDGLMAIFFFVVCLEITREIVVVELSSRKKAILPVCAAIGGAVVPTFFASYSTPVRHTHGHRNRLCPGRTAAVRFSRTHIAEAVPHRADDSRRPAGGDGYPAILYA